MGKFNDLTGKQFGRLTVLCKNGKSKAGHTLWKCKCECGNVTTVFGCNLTKGVTNSCGCFRKEKPTKHGMTHTRIRRIWSTMKQRCYNDNNIGYKNYGKRGIVVCDEWKNDFQAFYEWSMANGYTEEMSIDRIDVNGNYEPSNCRWVSMKEQQNNRTDNHYITHNGETHTMSEWADIVGIPYGTLNSRINTLHWSIERALTTI